MVSCTITAPENGFGANVNFAECFSYLERLVSLFIELTFFAI